MTTRPAFPCRPQRTFCAPASPLALLLTGSLLTGCAPRPAAPVPQTLGSAAPGPSTQTLGSAAPGPSTQRPAVQTSTPELERAIAQAKQHIMGVAIHRAQGLPPDQLKKETDAVVWQVMAATEWKVSTPIVEARVLRAIDETRLPFQVRQGARVARASRQAMAPILEASPALVAEIERERPAVDQAGALMAAREKAESERITGEIVQRIHGRLGGRADVIRLHVQTAVARVALHAASGGENPITALAARQAEHTEGPMKDVLANFGRRGRADSERLPEAIRLAFAGQPEEATRICRADFEGMQRVLSLQSWQHVNASGESPAHYIAPFAFQIDTVLSLARQNPTDAELARLGFEMVLYSRSRSQEVERRVSAALAEQTSADVASARERHRATRTAIAALELRRASGVSLTSSDERRLVELKQEEREAGGRLDELAALGRTMDKPFAVQGAYERLSGALKEKQALVSFVEYRHFTPDTMSDPTRWEPRYGLFVLTRKGLHWTPLSATAEVERAVHATLQSFATASVTLAQKQASAQALHRLVLEPAASALDGIEQLTVVPDGLLQTVPFEALHDGKSWLADRVQVTYAVSERQLGGEYHPRVQAAPPRIAAGGPYRSAPLALRLGEPLTRDHFGTLKGARAEVDEVRALLPGSEAVLDAKATESLLRAPRAPRILHIAAHGVYLPLGAGAGERGIVLKQTGSAPPAPRKDEDEAASMSRSALVLAPEGDASDGFLTAYEVASENLWGTELVVLSACETGRGSPDRARGMQGLRKAFFTAGADSLVMSLWSVDDRATRELMRGFYEELSKGSARAEALHKASKAVRARYPDPYFWAPFILLGETGPLGERSAASASGEDADSRLVRALRAKRAKRTHLRVGDAHFRVGSDEHVALDTFLKRDRKTPDRPLVITLLGKQASLSVRIERFHGPGRYPVGSEARVGVQPIADPLAVDIVKLHDARGQVAASEGTLEITADDVKEGLRGTLSVRLTDGRAVEGDLAIESERPDLPALFQQK